MKFRKKPKAQRGEQKEKRQKFQKRDVSLKPVKAVVDKNRKGFAFLIFEDKRREDAFVPPRQAESLFHGDRVLAILDRSGNPLEIRVLEHRFRELVGKFSAPPDARRGTGWVIYERKKAREEVFIPEVNQRVHNGDWVRIQLEFKKKGPYPVTGEILEVYGVDVPASADVAMIAAEYNLNEAHSEKAEQEALQLGTEVALDEIKVRKDLRKLPFITIDGETARDFDDAIFVERQKSGHVLWVAIADVSHYVKEGGPLDEEALARGTSVYFPERAFHMLPSQLSENLCSLRPNLPRLTLVAKMTFDRTGSRKEIEIMEAVIESKRRATYTEIQAEWEKEKKNSQWEFKPHFELYEILKKKRFTRGSLDFELAEPEVKVSPDGEVLSIENRDRLESHRLIEEFMIAANESVTDWMMEREWPFIYRVHDQPSTVALQKFQSIASTVGVDVDLDDLTKPGAIAELIRELNSHPAQSLLNMALLRSMKQAVYRSTHGIHFGLASSGYTHFTSPIRRYPDLVVHRLIRMALAPQAGKMLKSNKKNGFREELEEKLAKICEHTSYRERLAAEADREALKVKQVRFMMSRLGGEFEAQVIGMISTGIFMQVESPYVEGMVPIESMTDDFYEFKEERMIFYGRRKKRTIRIGEKMRVQVVRTDFERRQIEFRVL